MLLSPKFLVHEQYYSSGFEWHVVELTQFSIDPNPDNSSKIQYDRTMYKTNPTPYTLTRVEDGFTKANIELHVCICTYP